MIPMLPWTGCQLPLVTHHPLPPWNRPSVIQARGEALDAPSSRRGMTQSSEGSKVGIVEALTTLVRMV